MKPTIIFFFILITGCKESNVRRLHREFNRCSDSMQYYLDKDAVKSQYWMNREKIMLDSMDYEFYKP